VATERQLPSAQHGVSTAELLEQPEGKVEVGIGHVGKVHYWGTRGRESE